MHSFILSARFLLYFSHIHLLKYLTIPQNPETLRYTRIGIGDPNNHSFIFQHCSASKSPYSFHIEKVTNRTKIPITSSCIDRIISFDEIENHTYGLDEPITSNWSQHDRVLMTETNSVMPGFLEHYLKTY